MSTSYDPTTTANGAGPRGLTTAQVQMIEEALQAVGEFGEVRLVVEKGRLRFVVTQKSVDALKWRPAAAAPESLRGD